ncbi:MAG: hypothetical protein F6K04_19660 [Leptolyngbya sp. SIO4C5]|uniref:hypothetical protein n=1 Tax=Sphaerothrix gracilis TaxID=3151835 RepID=UPI0013C24548|nr:hypothetical protein [Leptolyngbya sp. SIO4C5]
MLDPVSTPNSAEVRFDKTFELQQVAQEFRYEVAHREALEAYCQWYYETAAAHQRELASMQRDVDFFGLFWRRRGSK